MAESEFKIEDAAPGVQDLIHRIRDEGIEVGKSEAENILREAREEAARIVAVAEIEAEKMLTDARERIAADSEIREEALRLAARDTIKELGAGVHSAFKRHVKRLVSAELKDRELLRQLILAIAGRTAADTLGDASVEILLSEDAFNTGDPGEENAAPGEQRIHDFILGISSEMLREGIEINPSSTVKCGASVRVTDEHLRVDLTDETLSEFLLNHLLPRYRRILYHGE